MLTAILEKGRYVSTTIVLFLRGQLQAVHAVAIILPDGLLALLVHRGVFQDACCAGSVRGRFIGI